MGEAQDEDTDDGSRAVRAEGVPFPRPTISHWTEELCKFAIGVCVPTCAEDAVVI